MIYIPARTGGTGLVNSVTGLNTDNTDTANPIVEISVDGATITGAGTPASPLVASASGGGGVVITEKVANYTAVAFDMVLMTTGTTDKTVTLPASPTKDDIIVVTKMDSDIGHLIVDGNGKNINGSATITIAYQYTSRTLQYTGTEWTKK